MSEGEITEDQRRMAQSIIPDGLSEDQQGLLEMAICFGIQMERERVESVKRHERFAALVESLSKA